MDPTDRKLSLRAFLKIFTTNDIPVSKAMALASKAYAEFNTPTRLTQLDEARLVVLGVEDRELRRSILAAIRNTGYTKPEARAQSSAVQDTATRPKKKRRCDSDLDERLQESPLDEASTFGNLFFEEILNEEILRSKTAVVNRAPVMTAWAMIVAERLGFDREESLSIASVYTEANAVSKGVSLGLVEERRKKDVETLPEGKQPYVDLMGRRQVHTLFMTFEDPHGILWCCWTGFHYTKLANPSESYSPQRLNELGYSLYADFRPAVDDWGKRGELRCARILSLKETGAPELAAETPGDAAGPSDKLQMGTRQRGQHPTKKEGLFSLEEYEATNDAGFDNIDLSHLP